MAIGLDQAIATKSILFIDPTVEDYQSLIGGLAEDNRQDACSTKIVVLDAYRDGIEQISETLTRNKGLRAVHLLSHGGPGCLYLGNSQLSGETVGRYATQLRQWGEALGENADILIYGCKVGADLAFVRQLRKLTGANIAASATPTGNAALGGDWNLEVTVGEVSASLPFTAEVRQAYAGLLAEVSVTVASDTVDGDTSSISALQSNPGTDGEISLREAIIAANNTVGDETINLTGGETYTLTVAGSEEDDSATGDLDIKNNGTLVVQTVGSGTATIDAGGSSGLGDRVFDVREDASLKLDNVVVTGGVVPVSFPDYDDNGGGILVNAGSTLELANSTISGNYASNSGGGIGNMAGTYNGEVKNAVINIENSSITDNSATAGGGITNVESILNITNSIISGNSATYGGGGIIHQGTETIDAETNIRNSTISGNFAKNGGGIAGIGMGLNISDSSIRGNSATNSGGGINATIIAQINNSTISSNSAEKGGGIYLNWLSFDTFTINNSTISGNSATEGGGIWNSIGTVAVNSSTISGNTATSQGGGLFNESYYSTFEARTYYGTATIANSIIAGNSNDDDVDGEGIFTSNGYNLIGNDTTGVFNQTGDQTGDSSSPLDGKLGPLQDNGGTTQTHALLADSQAIDTGNTSEINDQRGAPRDGSPDIGGFEFGATPPDTTPPTADSFAPADDATDVAVEANLEIQFSEDIQKGSGNVFIKQVSDNSVVETIDVTSSQVTVSGNTATIDPSDLETGTEYYIEIPVGAFADTAGNEYIGISQPTTWNFSTTTTEENVTLNPGDIAFVQYNADGTDNFKFVALVDIPESEEINFTDNGWKSDNTFTDTEGIITWTAPAGGISAGTVVEIETTPSASVGIVSESGSLNFAASGDQILAYQGTNTFIAALNNEGTETWQADAVDTNTSALPQGLTNGTDAVAINEIDNAKYTGITTGDKATLLAALNNSANWTGDDSTNQTFSDTFTLTSNSENSMTTTNLYNNTAVTPDDSSAAANGPWLSFNDVSLLVGAGETATQSADGTQTVLDTTGSAGDNNLIYAGYSNFDTSSTLVNSSFPTLDNTKGYTLSFTLQVVSEAKTAADIDYNDDGLDDRAGFSVIAISQDTSKSIEISFETDEIWAQDITGTSSTSLVRGEGVTFDTTTGLIEYDLKVLADDTYELYANDLLTLSGSLRDYTPINDLGVADPYEQSGSIFLGDRTDDARAEVNISAISVATTDATTNQSTPPFDFNSDGISDILWRNSSEGKNQIWLMNPDGSRNSIAYPGTQNANWQVIDVADFSNDGVPDILWRKPTDGNNNIWIMNADGSRNSIAYPGYRDTSWGVADVTDFSNDGVADILWRDSTTGNNELWLMNADGSRNSIAYPGYRDTSWGVVDVADFSNDGVSDILWRDSTTGNNELWLMNNDGSRNSIAYPGYRDTSWDLVTDVWYTQEARELPF